MENILEERRISRKELDATHYFFYHEESEKDAQKSNLVEVPSILLFFLQYLKEQQKRGRLLLNHLLIIYKVKFLF